MKVWTIAVTGLRRMLRDRSNLFFVFILPLAIILLVGAQFGSGAEGLRVVVSAGQGQIARSIVDSLAEADGIVVEEVEDAEEVADSVERGVASAGVVIPSAFDRMISAGETPQIGFVVRPQAGGSLQPVLTAAVADATGSSRVARIVAAETESDLRDALAVAEETEASGVDVDVETVGEALFPPGIGQFSLGAAQQLVLFVFLTALTGSAALIQSRQLGVSRRMLSTPTSATKVIVGEGAGRFLVGLFQGIYIIVVTLVVFGVDWGDPLGGVALLAALAATGAGAAMLLGSLFRNDQQAGGFSVMIGLGMAALGGCMLPLELFSPSLRQVAHLTPHAWAVDGFTDLVYRGGSLDDVLPELSALAVYAAALLAVSSWRLRKVITSG